MFKKSKHIILLIILFTYNYNSLAQQVPEESPNEIFYNEPDVVIKNKVEKNEYELRKFSYERMEELKAKKEFQYDERKIAEQQKQNERNYNQENRRGGNKQNEQKNESKVESRDHTTNNVPINDTSVNWVIVLVIFGIIVLAILLALGFKPSFLFRKNTEKVVINNTNSLAEDNLKNIKFESELEKAIRLKNYKLAIRFMYVELLKNLNDKQLIDWNKNKTNLDYVREIRNANLKPDFMQITNSFDYVWYGNFNIDSSTFYLMQDKMQVFKKRI